MDCTAVNNNKACHNCRRQRLRCDRSQPECHKCTRSGKQCLGYGALFRWTGAVASRGKLAGHTLPSLLMTNVQLSSTGSQTCAAEGYSLMGQILPRENTEEEAVDSKLGQAQLVPCRATETSEVSGEEGLVLPWVLADPLYQDMNRSYRSYLSYC